MFPRVELSFVMGASSLKLVTDEKDVYSLLYGKKSGAKQVGTMGEEIFNLINKTGHRKRS